VPYVVDGYNCLTLVRNSAIYVLRQFSSNFAFPVASYFLYGPIWLRMIIMKTIWNAVCKNLLLFIILFALTLTTIVSFSATLVLAKSDYGICQGWSTKRNVVVDGTQYKDDKGWFWIYAGEESSYTSSYPYCMGPQA
jgi:hypothetical protein